MVCAVYICITSKYLSQSVVSRIKLIQFTYAHHFELQRSKTFKKPVGSDRIISFVLTAQPFNVNSPLFQQLASLSSFRTTVKSLNLARSGIFLRHRYCLI